MFPITCSVVAATPATRAVSDAKVEHRIYAYKHDPRSSDYGAEAVAAMAEHGIEARQIFKTLVVELSDGRLAVAVVPVPDRLSLKAVAAALGASKAVMADPAKAQRTTGYVVGGISPLGQKKRLPTVVDESASSWHRVCCSAGRRGLEIELAPAQLVRLTDAVVARITSAE